jgi:hypothetical protein
LRLRKPRKIGNRYANQSKNSIDIISFECFDYDMKPVGKRRPRSGFGLGSTARNLILLHGLVVSLVEMLLIFIVITAIKNYTAMTEPLLMPFAQPVLIAQT